MARQWQPALEGEDASRAWSAIDEIADALSTLSDDALNDPTLACGTAGLALLFAYLSSARNDRTHENTAARLLDRAQESLNAPGKAFGAGLYVGFTGVAWVAEHITGEPQDGIDEHVLAYLSRTPWSDSYDLISGLTGIGVWALGALPRAGAAECLRLVCRRLMELAQPCRSGLTWWTSPTLLVESQRRDYPDGHENLGVAHGTPAAVSVLAQAWASGVLDAELRDSVLTIARAAGSRIMSLAHTDRPARYPTILGESNDASLAWCYGDLGISAALAVAAEALHEPVWLAEAEATALQAARRTLGSGGLRDAGLCHGASGVGLLFARLYHYFGHEELRIAARRYFVAALDLRRPGAYLGGFSAYTLDGHVASSEWLGGVAGIAQALIAAVSEDPPDWDRVLLASAS